MAHNMTYVCACASANRKKKKKKVGERNFISFHRSPGSFEKEKRGKKVGKIVTDFSIKLARLEKYCKRNISKNATRGILVF